LNGPKQINWIFVLTGKLEFLFYYKMQANTAFGALRGLEILIKQATVETEY